MHGNSTDGVNEESVVNEINGSVGSIKGNSVIDKSPEITSPRSPRDNSVDCPADDADVDHGIAVDHGVAENGRDNSVDCPADDADVDHGVDDNGVIDTSIEQLYENVCDMQSSDQSPSRQSFGSAGEESRIDSELRHLVGGEMREIEIMEEEEVNKPENGNHSDTLTKEEEDVNKPENGNHSDTLTKDVSPPASKKSGKLEKNQTSSTKSISSSISRKASRPTLDSEVSSKPTAQDKRPPEKPPIDKKDDKNLKKGNARVSSGKKRRNFPKKLLNGTEDSSETGFGNPDVARYLMKQAKDLVSAGDNLQKALELAVRASKSFEICSNGKPNLDLVMSLHVTAAIHCSLGQYSEAIPLLERSIEIPTIEEGQEHALAMFAGYMQLGDTYAMLGQLEKSTKYYITGLEVQKKVLGDTDPRVGETCRYLAEAHVQALQFDEAQTYCQMALDIHKENGSPATLEEAADRRLMGLICGTKGDHEAALEHFVLASMAMVANGHEHEVASIDCSIGDTYLSLSRYDEAIFAYQKALTSFKTANGENHPTVGSVFVRLAELYNRTGKLKEAKSYCESALRIYENPVPGIPPEDIASGLTDISAIYESMNELEQAIKLLQKALKIYDDAPGQQSTIAGIEAQMGVMYYMLGNFSESYNSFKNAISKLRASGEKKSAFFGIALNQMGLVCVHRYSINEATELFEEAKSILEQECGPYHLDTLGVYSNLAGAYDAMGRLDDAIEILDYVVDMREEKLGTANPDVDDEKRRLGELLKEAGRVRSRKGRSLEKLLGTNSNAVNDNTITVS